MLTQRQFATITKCLHLSITLGQCNIDSFEQFRYWSLYTYVQFKQKTCCLSGIGLQIDINYKRQIICQEGNNDIFYYYISIFLMFIYLPKNKQSIFFLHFDRKKCHILTSVIASELLPRGFVYVEMFSLSIMSMYKYAFNQCESMRKKLQFLLFCYSIIRTYTATTYPMKVTILMGF